MVKKKVQREFVEVQVLCYKKNEERFIYKKKMVSFVTKCIIIVSVEKGYVVQAFSGSSYPSSESPHLHCLPKRNSEKNPCRPWLVLCTS